MNRSLILLSFTLLCHSAGFLQTLFALDTEKRSSELIQLATEEFRHLTKAEVYLFRSVAKGQTADFSSAYTDTRSQSPEWAAELIVRGNRLSWLCTSPEAVKFITHHGVLVNGVKLSGLLDLSSARIDFPLHIEESEISQGITLENAELRDFSLSGSQCQELNADGVHIERDLSLSYGFTTRGEVRLNRARIGGHLDCSGGSFLSAGPDALFAEGSQIGGGVYLRYEFQSLGRVCFRGAKILGNVDCESSLFQNEDQEALELKNAEISGDVLLRDGYQVQGRTSLKGARIQGRLDCEGGLFYNPGKVAIDASGAQMASDLYFAGECHIEGRVLLVGAKVGGNLECDGMKLRNPNGMALDGKRLTVEGDLFFGNDKHQGFELLGEVNLESGTVRGTFTWSGMELDEQTSLNLRFASVSRLWYEPEGWPQPGHLQLHGFQYHVFYNHHSVPVDTLINWIRRQPQERYFPQPYDQLALVLQKGGHEDDAEQLLIAKEEDRLKELPRSERWMHRLLGVTIGYGYDPWRALWIGLFIVGIGVLVFELGSRAGLIAPTKEVEHVSDFPNAAIQLSRDYPRFSSIIYSLDMFVPLLDLQQGSYWLPSAERGWKINAFGFCFSAGSALRFYLGLHIYLGWALTTLLAVGLSGLVQS